MPRQCTHITAQEGDLCDHRTCPNGKSGCKRIKKEVVKLTILQKFINLFK